MLNFDSVLNITIKILISVLLIVGIYVFIQFSNRKLEDDDKIRFNKLKILRILLYILIAFIICFLFRTYPILRITLFTFIASVIIAYILNPFMKFLEKKNIICYNTYLYYNCISNFCFSYWNISKYI